MAIANKTTSVTEVWRALRLFTNRNKLIKLFISYLNDDPPKKAILFFHGDGGNGKSLLLRYLREHFCKCFKRESWEWINEEFSDNEFVEHIKETTENLLPCPFASIDFGLKTTNDDQPREVLYGLLMLRRQLATYGIKFPLFDFACVWYLHKTNQLSKERLKELFPAEEVDVLTGIVDAFSGTSYGSITKSFVNAFFKHWRDNFTLYMQKRGLDEANVSEIQQMDAETDLRKHLPEFFADDLNAAIEQDNAPPRIVLFFDTHESFWGHQREMSESDYFSLDEWLRRLLVRLNLESGIVAVVAGREHPRWSKATESDIHEEFIDAHLVGHLPPADADNFLERAGIEEAALRASLTKYAEVELNEVHPLYLGLCADIVLAAKQQNIKLKATDFHAQPQTNLKERELINRLLSYVDTDMHNAVCALAASRAFNREIFVKLGAELNFYATDAAFEVLLNFSFVWQAERRGEGWYRIHELLRRLFTEHDKQKIEAAHHFLEGYYRQRSLDGDKSAIAEAIFHTNKLDWKRGIDEWTTVFEQNLELSQYEICRALLEVRSEMLIKDDLSLAFVSQNEGDFYSSLSLHAEAIRKYKESIEFYDKSLLFSPNDYSIYHDKGMLLSHRGNLEAELSRNDKALQSYKNALDTFDKALEIAPNNPQIYNSKGCLLHDYGDIEIRVSRIDDARQSYYNALNEFEKALEFAPDYIAVYINSANVLRSLGNLEADLANYNFALVTYENCIISYNKGLQFAPDDKVIYLNKGLALRRRGDLQSDLSKDYEALESYNEAVVAFDQILKTSPDDIKANFNKGNVLLSRGELEFALLEEEDALQSYNNSLESFDKVLEFAPDNINAHNSKGIVLRKRGDLESKLSKNNDALASYDEALIILDELLNFAPDDVYALCNKGNVLGSRGELLSDLSRNDEALQNYNESYSSFNKAERLASSNALIRNNIGVLMRHRGDLKFKMSCNDEALQDYAESITANDQALNISPDLVQAHNEKGITLQSRGDLRKFLGDIHEACLDWNAALAEFSFSLTIAPNNLFVKIRRNYVKILIDENCPNKSITSDDIEEFTKEPRNSWTRELPR